MNIALILSSGIGQRMGINTPKQYLTICGKPVVSYVIEAAMSAKSIDRIIIVAHYPFIDDLKSKYPQLDYIEGGDTRNKSLRNGVDYIKQKYDCDNVIVLDAVRPFITGDIIDDYIKYTQELNYDICVTAKKITDSLCCLDLKECDRDRYFLTSSPMAFDFKKLDRYLDKDSKLVEVLQMYPSNTKIYFYYDYKDNYKLTYKEDLELLECIMQLKQRKSFNNNNKRR